MHEAEPTGEDTASFPAFKASLGQTAYDEIGERFEDIGHQTFGGDGFDIALVAWRPLIGESGTSIGRDG